MKHPKHSAKTACPIASAASCIGDMWTILITRDLLAGPKRFSELQRSIVSALSSKGINSRTLTNRLKMLETDNIVKRSVFPHEMPPRVEYSLTKKGLALSALIEQLRKFGVRYMNT
jgi:DNA-binding HxlR family transcriptional regulator